jgi:hypothetical protein
MPSSSMNPAFDSTTHGPEINRHHHSYLIARTRYGLDVRNRVGWLHHCKDWMMAKGDNRRPSQTLLELQCCLRQLEPSLPRDKTLFER